MRALSSEIQLPELLLWVRKAAIFNLKDEANTSKVKNCTSFCSGVISSGTESWSQIYVEQGEI